jgi:hypothetical protein
MCLRIRTMMISRATFLESEAARKFRDDGPMSQEYRMIEANADGSIKMLDGGTAEPFWMNIIGIFWMNIMDSALEVYLSTNGIKRHGRHCTYRWQCSSIFSQHGCSLSRIQRRQPGLSDTGFTALISFEVCIGA